MKALSNCYVVAYNKKDWDKLLLVLNSYLYKDRDYYWECHECQYVRFINNITDFKYGFCSVNELKNRMKNHKDHYILDLNEFLTKY